MTWNIISSPQSPCPGQFPHSACGLQTQITGFNSLICHLLSVWPLATYLSPLCLSLLVYNVGLPRVSMRIKWVNTEKTFDSECSINVTWKKRQSQNFISNISDIKNYTLGTFWWSGGQDSMVPMQEAQVRYQVRELDSTCCEDDQRPCVPQDLTQSNKHI